MDGNTRFFTAPAKPRIRPSTRDGRRADRANLAPAPPPESGRPRPDRVRAVAAADCTGGDGKDAADAGSPGPRGGSRSLRPPRRRRAVRSDAGRSRSSSHRASSGSRCGSASSAALWWAAPVELVATVRDFVRAVRYLRRHRIGVVHGYDTARNELYCFLLARVSRAKWVSGFHSQYGDWMSPVARTTLRHADLIAAVSDWTARLIVERGDISADRVVKVMNGTETARWDPAGVDGASVRRDLGIGEHAPLVVCVAQLAEWKRQHLLVRAFAQVVPRFPTAQLLLVGQEQEPWRRPGRAVRGRAAEADRASCNSAPVCNL